MSGPKDCPFQLLIPTHPCAKQRHLQVVLLNNNNGTNRKTHMYRKVNAAWKNRNKAQKKPRFGSPGAACRTVTRRQVRALHQGCEAFRCGTRARRKGFGAPVHDSGVTTERLAKAGATQTPPGGRPATTRRRGYSNPRTALASQLPSGTAAHRRPGRTPCTCAGICAALTRLLAGTVSPAGDRKSVV